MPTISVLIPTLNRPKTVLDTLLALENQSIESFEVIVIDQSDNVPDILNNFSAEKYQYRFHHIKEKGLPNARNVGAKLALGDILVFIDDDVNPDDGMLKAFNREFERLSDEYWMIAGRIWEQGTGIFRQTESIVGGKITVYGKTLKNFDTDTQGDCEWVAGGNFAVRRSRFHQVGGFDRNFIGNAILEDADFSYRIRKAGGRIFYSPRPKLEHLRIITGGTRTIHRDKAMFYRAHNSVYFFRKHKSLWQLPLVFLYLNGVAVKDFIRRKHSLLGVFQPWLGFIRGFATPIK